jgi:hypothetical protein
LAKLGRPTSLPAEIAALAESWKKWFCLWNAWHTDPTVVWLLFLPLQFFFDVAFESFFCFVNIS